MSVSIVGGESLLGRELREQLNEAGLGRSLQLIGAEDEITGILTEQEGEIVVMTPLDEDRLRESTIVFLAGTPESTLKAHKLLKGKGGPTLIDLTHTLEDLPNIQLHGLLPEDAALKKNTVHVVAHPAAAALALLFGSLKQVRHAVVQIFEPASERGQLGLNELQQQTSGLLAFQTLNKKVFDAQIGFNMLPRYGEDAPEQLQDVERRIEKHLTSILGRVKAPLPSIRLLQAPVFHGYSFSIWAEFDSRPDTAALEKSLATNQVEVRATDLEAPTNVGSVGQAGITVGMIEADRNHPRAVWMWAVADNFRLRVDTAIAAARRLQS